MKKFPWLGLIIAIALSLAGFAYSYYNQVPGRFIYSISFLGTYRGIGYIKRDLHGYEDTQRWLSNEDRDTGNVFGVYLTLTRDGAWAACLDRNKGVLTTALIGPAATLGSWNSHVAAERVLDISRQRLPYCALSNLEWSPDGKYLAYADVDKIHFIDAHTGQVTSSKLPEDADIEIIKSAAGSGVKVTRVTDGATNEAAGLLVLRASSDGIDGDKLGQNILQAIESESKERALKLGQQASDGNFGNQARDGTDYSKPAQRSSCTICSDAGRTIRWCANDTILCDNLQLTLKRDNKGIIGLSVKHLPLPCAFSLRPMWNWNGSMAAYVIPRELGNLDLDAIRRQYGALQPCRLFVVDRTGKLLLQREVLSKDSEVQWSRNGRSVATRSFLYEEKHGTVNTGILFTVYDTQSSRQWQVRGGNQLADSTPDWVWDY